MVGICSGKLGYSYLHSPLFREVLCIVHWILKIFACLLLSRILVDLPVMVSVKQKIHNKMYVSDILKDGFQLVEFLLVGDILVLFYLNIVCYVVVIVEWIANVLF